MRILWCALVLIGLTACASIDPVERAKCWTYAAAKTPDDVVKGQIMADQAKGQEKGATIATVLSTVAARVGDPQAQDACGVYLGQLAAAGSAKAGQIKGQIDARTAPTPK